MPAEHASSSGLLLYDRDVTVYTIGHSTRTLEDFVTLVSGAGIQRIVDVRAFPMSRRHPHFTLEHLPPGLRRRAWITVTCRNLAGGARRAAATPRAMAC